MRPAILAAVLLFVLAGSASAVPAGPCPGGVCVRRPGLHIRATKGVTVEVRQGLFGLRRTSVNTR